MTARKSPKRTKRMWGVGYWNAHGFQFRAVYSWPRSWVRNEKKVGETIIPVTVTWSSPNKRKAKR